MERTLLFIIAIVAGTQAGPIQEIAIGNQCAKQCSVSNKFNYEPGTTYEFKYENEILTALEGAAEDHAGLTMSAVVNIDFITKCEAVMRLTDVIVKEHDPETSKMKVVSADLKALLEKDPLGFSYQDGNIEQLCLADNQDVKVLNVKRGILSMFQNNMDDITQPQTVKESDVAGTCDTEYTSTDKGWYNVVVKKSKQMLSCTNRHDSQTALQGIPYDSQSKIQSLPIVKSTHNCEQELVKESGRLVSVSCVEHHMFAPFSRKDSGANTVNTQDLTFVRQSKIRTKPVSATKVTGLHFDHSTPDKLTNKMQDLEGKLQEVCKTTKNGIKQETPRLFTSLIYTMKKMEASEISTVFQEIKSKKICKDNNERVRKFFLDAIPMAGTPASLKLLTQLLVNDEITGIEAEMWLTTLAFMQEPTVDMLTEVKPLLTMSKHEEKAMLSVSSLVHSLCRNNPDCENYMEVRKIISLLENKIAPACKVTPKTMQTTLIALRAIGNAGHGTTAIPSLNKCIMKSSNPIEIRLSAIEAYRRIPCKADKSTLMSVFTNMDEDSEVRIAAYKSMMECPSTDILKKVKVMLGREEVNQVGSYVWSHLTNLMETSDPHKQTIRSILQDETLQKEFDMDKRKFSRNYEGSFFLEKMNTGATVESDLIWSSKSFIPRSAMVNLTVDLFGNAINLLEIGGRLEGLEYFLEQYFGPNGYFSENDVQAAVDESAIQTIKGDKAQRINKRMGSVMDDLRGSLYMRVFGNELRYMNFDGIDSLLQSNSFNILDMLKKLSKDNEYQFSQSTMFMDSSLMIPTYSGFPMNLTVNGIATIDMKTSGKVDVMKMSSRPRGMDIHGMLKPSAALEVTSTMSVDALVTKVGLKMVSSLYTSTAIQGKVSLVDGSILDMEFDLPEDKMEIINVKSSFFTVHRDVEREQNMITDNKQASKVCSGSKLATIAGVELCGELSYPNASLVENAPYFPLTGPVSASVILYKRDTLTSYKLEARSTHTGESNIVRLAFSTPKSKVDRDFGINFNLNKNDGTVDMSLNSPIKKANFAGSYHFDKKSAGVSGKLNVDNSLRYEVKLGVDSEKSGPGMLYTPTLVVQVPGKTLVDLSGTLKYAPWKRFDLDMTLSGIVKPPVKAQVTFLNKLKLVSVSASAEMGKKQHYTFDASCQKIVFKKKVTYKPQISVRTPSAEILAFGGGFTNIFGKVIKIDAILDKITSKPIILKKAVFGVKEYSRGRKLYNVNLDFKSSPMDLKMKSKFDNRNMKTLATDIDLTYVIRKVARDNIKFVSKIINLSTKALTKLRTPMSFTSKLNPDYNVKLAANLDHNKKHSQIDADISYGPNAKDTSKQISLLVSLDKAIRNWSKASAEFTGEFRKGNDIRIVSKLKHQHDTKSLDSSVNLRLNKNAVTASLSLKDQSATLKNLEGQFDLSIPGKTISISQSVKETKPSEFLSVTNARLGKMQNKIETSWMKVSPSALTVNAKINLHNTQPMAVQGGYDFSPKMLKASGTFEKGSNKYSISSTSEMTSEDAIETTADIQYPSRRIIASFEQKKENDMYTSRADLRWDADKDDSQRVVIKSKGKMTGLNNIDGSFTIQYPSRNIVLNVKHFLGKKYSSHIDMQWEPNEIYSVDTVFGQYEKQGLNETEGHLKVSTPFKTLRDLTVTINQQTQNSEFKTKLDVAWNPKNIISSTLTVGRPISLKSFNAELIAKAPYVGLKNMQASLRHRISNGARTVGKVLWNKQSAQIDLSLDDASDDRKTDIKGEVNLKSSFKDLRTAKLNVAHLNNGNNLQTSLTVIRNKKEYGVSSFIKHRMNGWSVNNNGEFKIYSPKEDIKVTWDHANTLNDITSSTDITWGKNKRIYIKYSGLQNFRGATGSLSSALEVKSTFMYLTDIVAQISHEHGPGQIDSSMTVINDGIKVASVEGKYLRHDGQVKSSLAITNPSGGGDVTITLDSDYEAMPKTIHMEVMLSPQKTITVDGTFSQDSRTNIDSVLSISSPFFDEFKLKGTRQVTSNGIVSAATCEYAPNKIIRMQSVHSLKEDKFMKITFQSPYTREYSAEVGVKGTMENFQARVEVLPFLKRWTATGSFDRRTGITLKVNTPYPEVAYSHISIRSETVNGDRTSTLTVEYIPGQIINFVSSYNFENSRNLKFSVGLETPFEEFPKSVFEFTHRGPMSRFVNHILLEYKPGKTISVDTSFSNAGSLDGTMVIVSPWTNIMKGMVKLAEKPNDLTAHGEFTWKRTLSFDMIHKGSLSAFSTVVKLTDGEDIISGNIDYTSGPKTTTDISIRTPMQYWKNIKVTHSLEGNIRRFNNHLEISAAKFGTYTTDLNIDMTTGISGEIVIQTPIQGYKNMKASVAHTGTLDKFDTHVEVQTGVKKFSGAVKLATKPAIIFVISVKTPIQGYTVSQVSWTHDGSSIDFKSNLELQLNKDISEIDLSYNFARKLNVDLAIRSPYFEDVKVSIDHWGKPSRFTSKIRARAGKQRMSTDVLFQLNPSLNAQISIKSPFALLKNQQLSIKHAGSLESFKCNMQYRCNGKIYAGDATFDKLDSIKGEVNLKGPDFKPINLAFDVKKDVNSFKSTVQASLGKKIIKADAYLNTQTGVNGNLALNSPFDGFKSITASISHSGPISNFKTQGELSFNKKRGSVLFSFDKSRDLTASIEIGTPLTGYEKISSSVSHIGGMDDFETIGQFKINEKSLDLRAAFRNDKPLTMSASLISKFSSVPNMDATFSYKNIFNARGDLNVGQQKLDFEAVFNAINNGYTGKVSTNMPWVKRMAAEFTHEVIGDSITTEGQATYGGASLFRLKSDIQKKSPISVTITVNTPLKTFETTVISLLYSKAVDSLTTEASVMLNKEIHEARVSAVVSPSFDGSVSIKSPLMKDIAVTISVDGTAKNFRSQLETKYDRESIIRSEFDLRVNGPISADLKIISPLMKNIKASLNHDGTMKNFKSDATFIYGGRKSEGMISMNLLGEVQLIIKLATPFTNDLDVTMNGRGSLPNAIVSGDVMYGGVSKFSLNANLDLEGSIDTQINIRTPFRGFSRMSASLSHQGKLTDFKTNAELTLEGQTVSAEVSFNPASGNILFKSPMLKDVKLSFVQNGNFPTIQSQANILYGPRHLLDLSLKFNLPNEGELKVTSPIFNDQTVRAAFYTLKNGNGLDSHAEINLNGETHEADLNIDMKGIYTASVNTPLFVPVTLTLGYEKKPLALASSGALTFGSSRHEYAILANVENGMQGSLHLKSNLMPELQFSCNANDDFMNLKANAYLSFDNEDVLKISAETESDEKLAGSINVKVLENQASLSMSASGNGYKKLNGHVIATLNKHSVEGDVSFTNVRNIKALMNLKSSFTRPISAKFIYGNDKGIYTSNGNIVINSAKHEYDVEINTRDKILTKLAITSPVVEPVSASVSLTGNVQDFAFESELMYGNSKSSANIALNVDSAFQGSLAVVTPLTEPLKTTFDYSGSISNFKTLASCSYGTDTLFDTEITWTERPLQGKLQLNTMTPGYENIFASFKHDGDMLSFTNHAEINISGDKSELDISLNAATKLEGRIVTKSPYFPSIETGFELTGTPSKFDASADISIANAKYSLDTSFDSTTDIHASFKMSSPINGYRTLTGKLSHSGVLPNIISTIELKSGRRNLALGNLKTTTVDGYSVKMSLQSSLTPAIQLNLGHKGQSTNFKSVAEILLNGKSSSLNVEFKSQPSLEGSYTFSTPWKTSSGSFNIDVKQNGFDLKAETRLDSEVMSIGMAYQGGNNMGMTVTLQTPFENFEHLKGTANFNRRYNGFSAQADVELPSHESIELIAQLRGMTGNIILKTPFDGLKYSAIETKYDGQFPNVVSGITVTLFDQRFAIDSELDGFSGKLTVSTPIAGYENTIVSFNKQGPLTDMQASFRLTIMNEEIFASLENKLTANSLETKARLETPYTEDLIFELSHTGSMYDCHNSVVLSMGPTNSLSSATTFKLEHSGIDVESTLSTVVAGYSDEQKIKLNFKESFPNFKTTAFFKILGSEYTLDSSLDTRTNLIGKLSLTTPFQRLRDISVDVEHTGNARRFETKATIEVNSEKLSSKLSYMKYGWRRLQTSLDVKTTFKGFEHNKVSYRHTAAIDSFECIADASVLNQDFTSNIRASNEPLKAQITVTTPFSGFQQVGADIKIDIGAGIYNTEANLAFMQDKTISVSSDINFRDSPRLVNLKISTPFAGFETTDIKLSHSGDYLNFQSTASVSTPFIPAFRAQGNLRTSSISNFDGTIVFNSQIRNFEKMELNLKNEENQGKYKTHLETTWALGKTITLTSELTDYTDSMSADISLSTPFTSVRQFSMKAESKVNRKQYLESIIIKHNQETCIDMDINVDTTSGKPSGVLILREPTPLRAEVGGTIDSTQYAGRILVNGDLKIEASYEIRSQRTTFKYECPRHSVLLKNQMNPSNPKADLYINNKRYGYELSMARSDGSLKVILPSRSLKVSGSHNQGKTEGTFMWDADKDERKMVGIKSELTRSADSVKADITLQMPGLRKDVRIDSEMVLNRGRVIFEGKTDFTYSKDSRKTITLTSRLMDISNDWKTKNYSFSLGLQHPFTTVGVKFSSHLGKSRSEYTGGFGLEYLTARRETKTFSVNGEINKLRHSAKLNMDTPLKKISISGDSQMQDPFSVSLVNQYDGKRPLRTFVTLDAKNKKVGFQMNYDLDNPSSEFHFSAKYVNSSAILSEVSHVVNRQKVTDALVFLRLNNSHLLHNRLHWRPTAIKDLEEFFTKKNNEYKVELAQLVRIISSSIRDEVRLKSSAVQRSISEEMKPFAEIMEKEIEKLIIMYEENAYHMRDITNEIVHLAMVAEAKFETASKATSEKLHFLGERVQGMTKSASIKLEDMKNYVAAGIVTKVDKLLEPLYNMTQHPSVVSFRHQVHSNYITYMDQLTSMPQRVPQMADTYTSAIYGARDSISSSLSSILQRDDVKYVKSYADPMVAQGKNAYKYWEIRENVEMVVDAIIDMIKSEIEKELSDLKASVFSLTKTTFTVYDPANGEIQAEVHLPIPLRSLDEIPAIDVTPYISKAKQYKAKLPGLPQISTDVSTWLPPFDAYATIHGDKVTTFDGTQYDLDGSCSFLLAKDFVDGNFSLVLHKQDNKKSLLILADGKAITILADGKVLVDNKPVEMPVTLKNITISSVDKVETVVKGAGSFEVSYLPLSDLTTVKLNGWYFGKTSGLLGTYDNEPSTDFMSSYGRQIDNPSRFARTWDMSLTKCR